MYLCTYIHIIYAHECLPMYTYVAGISVLPISVEF